MKYRLHSRAYAVIVGSVMTMALTLGLAAVSVTAASAGGGTGITASSAKTITFNGTDAYTAQFVRSASGVINQTNRVHVGFTNNWVGIPFDVWVQFRPLTGPSGTGNPTANPACESPTVVPPVTYLNSDTAIAGTPTSGYFITGVPYNVCVYFAHSFALSILANGSASGVSYNGQDVTYSGVETYGGTPVVADPVTLTVWNGYGCVNPPLASVPAGVTSPTGAYSLDAGNAGIGTFSIQASTTHFGLVTLSSCLNLTQLPDMSLSANGQTTLTVSSGTDITYAGTLFFNGGSVGSQSVDMNIFTLPGCTGPQVGGFPLSGVATTDGSGNYIWGPSASTQAGPTGTFYLMTSSGGYDSNCITVNVT